MMQFIRGSGGSRHRGWAPINIFKKWRWLPLASQALPGSSHLTQVENHKQKGTGGRGREPMTDSQPVPTLPQQAGSPCDSSAADGRESLCASILLRSPELVVAAVPQGNR